ncbi:MAG: sulfotransferase family protein [Myxococcota bacterium]
MAQTHPAAQGPQEEAAIILVSGTPRSGTSLMMQMLEAAGVPLQVDHRRPADASNPRGYFELEAVKATRRDAGWVSEASGRAVKVIHAHLAHLPPERSYRVLWMERDAREVVASQNRMLARSGDDAAGVSEARLIDLQERQATAGRTLLEEAPHFEWLPVSHAALLRDPMAVAREVVAFLGLDAPAAALAAVVDPRLYRERTPGDEAAAGDPARA